MGITISPALAQHVSNYIINVLKARLPRIGFDIVPWIDNFILLANAVTDDAIVRRAFDDLVGANGLNLVMKPWEGGGQELDVLGMHVDLARGIVSPTEGKQQAVAQRAHRLIQGGPTNLDLLRWSGLISWMCYSTARYPLWFSQRIRCKH
ncbi:MAG: hypothetical protein JKX97_09135 [Candidatus Lindowbacteria bacterium]|nr:hypothetical protein [Candidatus Lindowbacteria bacterium]